MSTKLAANSFLEVIQKSNLVAADELTKLVSKYDTQGVDTDNARALGDALVKDQVLTTWQVEKLLQGKHKGFFLGPYRMLNLLGKGGMGAVYLAEHEMMKRRCAIKVLPAKYATENSSVLERFYVEAQAVAALDDPNIVRAYDLNKEVKGNTTIHYLVMEYIQGRDIQDIVKEDGVLDYVAMADYTRQAANGLAHAHEKGLIHRDIKPANLLVDQKGTVKILDLGLARFFDSGGDSSLTIAYNDTVLGTADYLSPEQALNSHEVDMRTDIYSLGCTCYFMLTGRPPFPDGTVAQRLVAHQVKAPESLTVKCPDIPYDLVAIIEKMMAKDPNVRYRSAQEVSAAMLHWLIHHGSDQWKREHSEMLSDSSVSVTATEPTRASSSPTSDTELELLPLDDDDDEGLEIKPSDKSGSTAAAAKAAPDAEAQDLLAPDAEQVDSLEEIESLEEVGSLDEVGSLMEIDAASFESTGNDGLLGSFNEPDLMSSMPESDPLGSSNVLHMETLSVGSSVSGKKPASGTKQNAPVEAERASILTSPPVLIGVGAGLLALIAIFVIVFMAGDAETPAPSSLVVENTDTVDPVTDNTQTPSIPTVEPQQIDDQPNDDQPNDRPTQANKKIGTTQPDNKQASISEPRVDPEEDNTPNVEPPSTQQSISTPPFGVPDTEPPNTEPPETEPPNTEPPNTDPAVTVKQSVTDPAVTPKNTQPKVTPRGKQPPKVEPPKPKEIDEAEKRRLFATATEMKIDLDLQGKPESLLSKMIVTTAENHIGKLNLATSDEGGQPAVIKLRLTEEDVDKVRTFKISAEVQSTVESDAVTLWKNEKVIGRIPQKMSPSQANAVFAVMRREVEDFLDEFSTAYKLAKNKQTES